MRNLNYVQVVGRLGKDPELKETKNGIKVVDFSICNNRDYKDKDGNLVARPNWIQCRCYSGLAETICKYLHKGSKIAVGGELTVDTWENDKKELTSRTYILVTEMEMLDKKEEGTTNTSSNSEEYKSYAMIDEDIF